MTKPESRKTADVFAARFFIELRTIRHRLPKTCANCSKARFCASVLTANRRKISTNNLSRTENYLSLTGLLILVLGGVGVWNVARVFVEQKQKAVAVLKCLGASGNKIITVYLLQILALGFVGSLFGVFLAQCALWFAEARFAADLPEKLSYIVPLSAALQGVLLGVLISLLFSALPLLQVRNIKPNLLLRDETGEKLRRLDWTKWIFGAVCLAGLLGLAVWQAGSLIVGAFFLSRARIDYGNFVSDGGCFNVVFAPSENFRLVFIFAGDQLSVSSGQSNADNSARSWSRRVCRSLPSNRFRQILCANSIFRATSVCRVCFL